MKNILHNKYWQFAIQVLGIILGCFFMGIAYNCFYTPNNVTPSGFMGLCTVITSLLARADIIISPSILYFSISFVLFLIALKSFGWRFGLLTLIGMGIFTVASEFVVIDALIIQNDIILAAVIGASLLGLGSGIVFRVGGSTGGSDIVAALVTKTFPKIKTGQCLMVINAIVVVSSILLSGDITSGLYTIIAIFISGKMVDIVLDGSKAVRALYIICDKDEEVAEKILETFNRGVTKLPAEGMFSHKEKKLLVCLVTNEQAPAMKSIIKQADPNSFVYSTTVRETLGESFFLREASVRKDKIRNANPTLKYKVRCIRKSKFNFTKKKLFRKRKFKFLPFGWQKKTAISSVKAKARYTKTLHRFGKKNILTF